MVCLLCVFRRAELQRWHRAAGAGVTRQAWALAEHRVVLDRAAVSDHRARVHDHVRAERHAIADDHTGAQKRPRRLRAARGTHNRTTLALLDARVTPRRSSTRRARRAISS